MASLTLCQAIHSPLPYSLTAVNRQSHRQCDSSASLLLRNRSRSRRQMRSPKGAHSAVICSASSMSTTSTTTDTPPPVTPSPLTPSPAALVSLTNALEGPPAAAAITHLEANSWLLEVGGVRLLVDPILEGPVDFGMPALIIVKKRQLENLGVAAVAGAVDAVLLTQGLDDHCHVRTLQALSALRPDIPIISCPSAQELLHILGFSQVSYLQPGQSLQLSSVLGNRDSEAGEVSVRATAGASVGPPWQAPENGYIVSHTIPGATSPSFSVYIEPHCMYDPEELKELEADVVVSHVLTVSIPPGIPVLNGMQSAVDLAKLLNCKKFVVYRNEDTIAGGIFPKVVKVDGSRDAFQELLKLQVPSVEVLVPEPGEKILFPTTSP